MANQRGTILLLWQFLVDVLTAVVYEPYIRFTGNFLDFVIINPAVVFTEFYTRKHGNPPPEGLLNADKIRNIVKGLRDEYNPNRIRKIKKTHNLRKDRPFIVKNKDLVGGYRFLGHEHICTRRGWSDQDLKEHIPQVAERNPQVPTKNAPNQSQEDDSSCESDWSESHLESERVHEYHEMFPHNSYPNQYESQVGNKSQPSGSGLRSDYYRNPATQSQQSQNNLYLSSLNETPSENSYDPQGFPENPSQCHQPMEAYDYWLHPYPQQYPNISHTNVHSTTPNEFTQPTTNPSNSFFRLPSLETLSRSNSVASNASFHHPTVTYPNVAPIEPNDLSFTQYRERSLSVSSTDSSHSASETPYPTNYHPLPEPLVDEISDLLRDSVNNPGPPTEFDQYLAEQIEAPEEETLTFANLQKT